MSIYVLFGQRICDYPGQYAPEALEVMDEFAYSENGEWLLGKLEAAEKTNEFEGLRIVQIDVGDMEKLRELVVGIPLITGEVKGAE